MKKNIAILGAGIMGQSIASGLLSKKIITANQLILTNIIFNGLEIFANQGVVVTGNNIRAVQFADVIFLAVKPQIMDQVLKEIEADLKENQLIISIAAGISLHHIEKIIGSNKKLVRVMPNLCAQVSESMSCWVANKNLSEDNRKEVKTLLSSIGKQQELKSEAQIDSITPISGSGPAYVFYIAEMLEDELVKMGIDHTNAHVLVKQTIIGSSKVLENSEKSFQKLRENVTSKGGVTEQAITIFEEKNLKEIFHIAIQKAVEKSKALNK